MKMGRPLKYGKDVVEYVLSLEFICKPKEIRERVLEKFGIRLSRNTLNYWLYDIESDELRDIKDVFLDKISRMSKMDVYKLGVKKGETLGALEMYLKLKKSEINKKQPLCPYCTSTNIDKHGFRYNRFERKQKYWCRACNKKFTEGGNKIKYPEHIREFIKNQKGSLREIKKKTNSKFGLKISHTQINTIRCEK